jgi:hypothetical protein
LNYFCCIEIFGKNQVVADFAICLVDYVVEINKELYFRTRKTPVNQLDWQITIPVFLPSVTGLTQMFHTLPFFIHGEGKRTKRVIARSGVLARKRPYALVDIKAKSLEDNFLGSNSKSPRHPR